ncbi:MAG: SDR family oxidoreductase [Alicyclobacillaceae bacterium]|nr:SDR family oxidoreductase [Alicyclobacillaceae bacterium]
MSGSFADQVAIITGAAGAIGSAVARRLQQAGAHLVLVDQPAAVETIRADEFPGAVLCAADVTQEADVEAYVRQAVSAFGRIDLFFNNAGIEGKVAPIVETTVDEFERVMRVNTLGVFLGLREVLRVFSRQGTGGAIVNSASMAGFRGGPGLVHYVASKHAVIGLTRTAAREAAAWNVRVNAVAPGYIESRMLRSINAQLPTGRSMEEISDHMISQVPMQRLGTPDDVAAVVCWLLGPESAYVTGTVTVIDGGLNC